MEEVEEEEEEETKMSAIVRFSPSSAPSASSSASSSSAKSPTDANIIQIITAIFPLEFVGSSSWIGHQIDRNAAGFGAIGHQNMEHVQIDYQFYSNPTGLVTKFPGERNITNFLSRFQPQFGEFGHQNVE